MNRPAAPFPDTVRRHALRLMPVLLTAALLAACSARAPCKGERPYQRAETVDLQQRAGDMPIPRSSSALVIPEEPREGPAYAQYYEDDKGRERIRCLDEPPRLAPLPDAD